jgi:hypothetical protein
LASSGMRVVKKPRLRPTQQWRLVRQSVVKELKPVARQHVKQRDRVVSRWAHQPKFEDEIKAGPKQVSITVRITNAKRRLSNLYSGTIGDLWKWHNLGTRPHKIVPRFASILRFVASSGQVVFTTLVNHPGTKAQRSNERINRRLRRALTNAVSRGMRKGFKDVERRNK